MVCTGNNHQFLIITFQLLEHIFAEVAGVRLFAVNDKYGILDFVRTAHKREVDEWNGFSRIPSLIGVERAFVITARGLVVGVVVFEELRGVGRQFIRHTSAWLRKTNAENLGTLCRTCITKSVVSYCIVVSTLIVVTT